MKNIKVVLFFSLAFIQSLSALANFECIEAGDLKDFKLQDVVIPNHVQNILEEFKFALNFAGEQNSADSDDENNNDFELRVPRGMLFYGPPGCGKTLLAKSFANALGVNFIQATGSDFHEIYIGSGAVNIKRIFELARENSPCVLFIDEIDSLAQSRHSSNNYKDQDNTLNQLLSELDGAQQNKDWDGIILIAATNAKDRLDAAITRPGRLDKLVEIGLPSFSERKNLFRNRLQKNKFVFSEEQLCLMAEKSSSMSGATIVSIVSDAVVRILKQQGKHKKNQLDAKVVLEVLNEHLKGVATNNFDEIDEKQELMLAHYQAGKAVVALLLGQDKNLTEVELLPKAKIQNDPQDKSRVQKVSALEAKIKVLLAGLVAENICLKERSTFANEDLAQAKKIALQIAENLIIDEHGLKLVPFVQHAEILVVNKCLAEVEKLLQEPENKLAVEKLAKKLICKRVLTTSEVKKLLNFA